MIKICLGISENISVKITAFYANFLQSKTKLSPNLYDFAFVGNRRDKNQIGHIFWSSVFPPRRTLFNTIRHSLHSGFSNTSGYHYHSIYPFSYWLPSNTVLYWDRIRGHLRAFQKSKLIFHQRETLLSHKNWVFFFDETLFRWWQMGVNGSPKLFTVCKHWRLHLRDTK